MEHFDANESYDICVVNSRPYLFTNERIDRKSIPAKLFCYDVADGDGDGCFARIQPYVVVNHWGTIIGKDPLPLDLHSLYYPEYGTYEYEGDFIGQATLDEYLSMKDFSVSAKPYDGEICCETGHSYYIEFSIGDFGPTIENTLFAVKLEAIGIHPVELKALREGDFRFFFRCEEKIRTMEMCNSIMDLLDELSYINFAVNFSAVRTPTPEELFIGYFGNGATVTDKTHIESGWGYEKVCHISDCGKVTWYVNPDMLMTTTLDVINRLSEEHEAKWDEKLASMSEIQQYAFLMDQAPDTAALYCASSMKESTLSEKIKYLQGVLKEKSTFNLESSI